MYYDKISRVNALTTNSFLIGLVTFQQSIQIELGTKGYVDSPDFLPIYLSTNRSVGASCYTSLSHVSPHPSPPHVSLPSVPCPSLPSKFFLSHPVFSFCFLIYLFPFPVRLHFRSNFLFLSLTSFTGPPYDYTMSSLICSQQATCLHQLKTTVQQMSSFFASFCKELQISGSLNWAWCF